MIRRRVPEWAFARRPDIRSPLPRERVLFLAPTFEQARFWAREWGYFGPIGWRHVGRPEDLHGYARQTVVYVCGPRNYSVQFDELLELAQAGGYTLIDAQDLDAVERHRASIVDEFADDLRRLADA